LADPRALRAREQEGRQTLCLKRAQARRQPVPAAGEHDDEELALRLAREEQVQVRCWAVVCVAPRRPGSPPALGACRFECLRRPRRTMRSSRGDLPWKSRFAGLLWRSLHYQYRPCATVLWQATRKGLHAPAGVPAGRHSPVMSPRIDDDAEMARHAPTSARRNDAQDIPHACALLLSRCCCRCCCCRRLAEEEERQRHGRSAASAAPPAAKSIYDVSATAPG
jgi:hypothetical protein